MKIVFRLLISLFICWGLTSALAADSLPSKSDRLSYALGAETGKSFRNNGIPVVPWAFSQGLQDGLNGNKMLLTDDQIQQELKDFQKSSISRLQSQMQQTANKNQQIGHAFLAANKERPGVITTRTGLQYKILTPGNGPTPKATEVVTVDYEGRLLDGKVFDSSYERGKPAAFPVNNVIPGWQEALKLMPVGSTWELYIPSELAYGEEGAQGVIGPNETLVFKVHLISTQPGV